MWHINCVLSVSIGSRSVLSNNKESADSAFKVLDNKDRLILKYNLIKNTGGFI